MLHTVEMLHFQNALHAAILTKLVPKLVKDLLKVMVSVSLSRGLEFGWSLVPKLLIMPRGI
jgi:hypothetical protein